MFVRPLKNLAVLSALFIGLGLMGEAAEASILFGPAVRYSTSKTTDQTGFLGGNSENSRLIGDAHLGLLIEGTPVYIGGLYSYDSAEDGSSNKMTGTSYGASVGYYSGAFSVIGTYLVGADRTYKTGGVEAKLSSGVGYRVDVAYVAGLTNAIGIGPQITYESVKYSKSTPAGGSETTNTYETSSLSPGLVMWFRF